MSQLRRDPLYKVYAGVECELSKQRHKARNLADEVEKCHRKLRDLVKLRDRLATAWKARDVSVLADLDSKCYTSADEAPIVRPPTKPR